MMYFAPALLIAMRLSKTMRFSSRNPIFAAALAIEYSPLTWYATIGMLGNFSTPRAIMSRYGMAGFTIVQSAPSATSASISPLKNGLAKALGIFHQLLIDVWAL